MNIHILKYSLPQPCVETCTSSKSMIPLGVETLCTLPQSMMQLCVETGRAPSEELPNGVTA